MGQATPADTSLDDVVPALIGRPRRALRGAEVLEKYSAQLGELAWHAVTVDHKLADMSERHAGIIRGLISKHLTVQGRPLRVLEAGAYAHYSVHLVSDAIGAVGAATDISPASLREGAKQARAKGLKSDVTLVAADFHDLPFNSDYFDLVFVASAVHHTFRPWVMMQELFRVTRPGGVVHLENEPVSSEFCFYQYRGNRDYELTPFERAVKERGLDRRLTSPFGGSRSEELFGIIENDRIPLKIYLDTFIANGDTIALSLDSDLVTGDIEKAVLAFPRDESLTANIAGLLERDFAELAETLSMRDVLMGFGVPRREQIWQLAYHVAERVRRLDKPESESYQCDVASIFGAALQATIVKRSPWGKPSEGMLSRPVAKEDGVYIDLPRLSSSNRLPPIDTAKDEEIHRAFPPTDWMRHKEDNGLWSMLNRSSKAAIRLEHSNSDALVLLRFYAAALGSTVYRVCFSTADRSLLDAHVICQSESRLARFFVPAGTDSITMTLVDLAGNVLSAEQAHVIVHMGIAQVVAL